MNTMAAVGFSGYGGADVLEPLRLPIPEPGAGEVRIRVAAAAVNPADWRIRAGAFRLFMRPAWPFVPGADVAGVVDAVGAGVSRFGPGDRVFAMLPTLRGGGYAEFAVAPQEAAAHLPSNVSLVDAAAAPLAALTALQALEGGLRLAGGERVLVYGASGGVGTFAVQLARALGARVTAACSGANAEWVAGLGAEAVLDYAAADVARPAEPYDALLDAVAAHPFRHWRHAVRRGGRVCLLNPMHGNPLSRLGAALHGRRLSSIMVRPDGAALRRVARWMAEGTVRPVVERCYPLAEAAEAHRRSETGRVRGKLVLVVNPGEAS